MVLPIALPWSAACGVTCRAAVQCCLSHRLSHHHALLPMVSPSRRSAQLPVVLPVAPQCAAARGAAHRTAVCRCSWCRLLHHHALLLVVLPVALPITLL